MNGIQEVDGSIPFGSTIPIIRRIRAEVVIVLVVLLLAIPGWVAIVARPPLRMATVVDTPDMRQRPEPTTLVNLAQLEWGTWYTVSSNLTFMNANAAYLADGNYERPLPRWTSQSDHDPRVTLHFARPSAIADIHVYTSSMIDRRQVEIRAINVRCDTSNPTPLARVDQRQFRGEFDNPVCNALTFELGHYADPRAVVSVSEIQVFGTQPEHTDLQPVALPSSHLPEFLPEGAVP